jgi:hypothetical protein
MKLKYYIYVSDSKVDMLFSQIPRRFLQGLAGELKINLGILSTSLKQDSVDETRYSKLELVSTYLERNEPIGTIDLPSEWIRSDVRVRWGPYGHGKDLVYFGGATEETIFGFGGSAKHIIGATGKSFSHSHSATPYLLAALSKELGLTLPAVESYHGWDQNIDEASRSSAALDAVDLASTQMKGPRQRVEIVAKRLLSGRRRPDEVEDEFKQSKILLGTPLYVAMKE